LVPEKLRRLSGLALGSTIERRIGEIEMNAEIPSKARSMDEVKDIHTRQKYAPARLAGSAR
jgi:hypothetical protein